MACTPSVSVTVNVRLMIFSAFVLAASITSLYEIVATAAHAAFVILPPAEINSCSVMERSVLLNGNVVAVATASVLQLLMLLF